MTVVTTLPHLRLSERTIRWLLAGCVLLGLALRLLAAWKWNAGHPDSPARLVGDEPGYDGLARDVIDGHGITWAARTPLYPYWLAALHVVGRFSYDFVVYVQAVVGTIAVPLTYLLGRRLFGPVAALLAAALTATNVVLIHQSVLLQTEVLFTPLVLWLAIVLHDALQAEPGTRDGAKQFLWVGVAIGFTDLLRPTLILFPAFVVLAALVRFADRRALATSLFCVLGTVAVVAPWTVRNWMKYGVFMPLSTSNALLWQGSPEYYHLTHDQGYKYMDVWRKVLYNRSDSAPDPGDIQGEDYWHDRAMRSIRAEPGVYLRYGAEKAVTYWLGDHAADWGDTYVLNYRVFRAWGASRLHTLQILITRLLIVPALIALVLLRRRWRDLLAITSILVYCTLLHAATHAEARLSDPLIPLLYVVIAGGLAQLASTLAARRTSGGRLTRAAA